MVLPFSFDIEGSFVVARPASVTPIRWMVAGLQPFPVRRPPLTGDVSLLNLALPGFPPLFPSFSVDAGSVRRAIS